MIKEALTKIFSTRQRIYPGTADGAHWMGGANNSATNTYITPDMARRVSAVFAAQRVVANGVACLPCKPFKNLKGGGKEVATKHELYRILKFAPNRYQDPTQFWTMAILQILDCGNTYWQKIYNGGGKLNELYPLIPENMNPRFIIDGDKETLVYEYTLPHTGLKRLFDPKEIFHITGMVVRGVKGIGVVQNAIETIGHSMATQEQSSKYFSNGTRPSGVLTVPTLLQEKDVERIKKSWNNAYGQASGNAWNVAVLEKGLDWKPLGLTNEESQFLETRKFDVSEIARWFGIPPHMIGDMEHATFGNIEEQSQEFIRDCVRPQCERIEAAITKQIIGEDYYEDFTVEFILDSMMRGKTLERFQAHQIALQNCIRNIDEVRAVENLNPLPNGLGKIYMQQMNMQPLDPNLREKDAKTNTNVDKNTDNPNKNDENVDDKPVKKEEKKGQMNVFNLVKSMIGGSIKRAIRREITARGKKNDPKMLQYLQEDFRNCAVALIEAEQVERELHLENSVREKIADTALRQWSEEWIQTSEREIDNIDSWESQRCNQEVENLARIVKGEMEKLNA